jgi:hypothetical protein
LWGLQLLVWWELLCTTTIPQVQMPPNKDWTPTPSKRFGDSIFLTFFFFLGIVSPLVFFSFPKLQLKLTKVIDYNHNTKIFRFAFDSPDAQGGFKLASFILTKAMIGGKEIVRPYTPISSIDQKGYFDLMIKCYPQVRPPSPSSSSTDFSTSTTG